MIPALQSALKGIQYNQNKLAGHASKISRVGTTEASIEKQSVSLPREFTGILEAQRGLEANISAFRASDEMLGSLIDVLA